MSRAQTRINALEPNRENLFASFWIPKHISSTANRHGRNQSGRLAFMCSVFPLPHRKPSIFVLNEKSPSTATPISSELTRPSKTYIRTLINAKIRYGTSMRFTDEEINSVNLFLPPEKVTPARTKKNATWKEKRYVFNPQSESACPKTMAIMPIALAESTQPILCLLSNPVPPSDIQNKSYYPVRNMSTENK